MARKFKCTFKLNIFEFLRLNIHGSNIVENSVLILTKNVTKKATCAICVGGQTKVKTCFSLMNEKFQNILFMNDL